MTLLEFCCEKKAAEPMRKSRFNQEQIIGLLREAEGTSVQAVCARHNISTATSYGWTAKFGGMIDCADGRLQSHWEKEHWRGNFPTSAVA